MDKIRLWLDCDPGHDDALALMFAVLHPRIELVGISTVFGNQTVDKTTRNALRVLNFLNRLDIPVYKGAAAPLRGHAAFCPAIHGESGLDLIDAAWPELPAHAAPAKGSPLDALAAAATSPDSDTRPLHLAVTGCQTNIAMFFSMFPEAAARLAGITVMGGAAVGGNTAPYAEFNIQIDADAAGAVLGNLVPSLAPHIDVTPLLPPTSAAAFGDAVRVPHPIAAASLEAEHIHIPVLIMPLDVTHTFLATREIFDRVVSPTLLGLLKFFDKTYKDVFGFTQGPPVHDVLAIAALVVPELFTTHTAHVAVEVANPLTRGMLIVDKDAPALRTYRGGLGLPFPLWMNARVAVAGDIPKLWDTVLSTLASVNVPATA